MLRREGVTDVTVERVAGTLTDHYDPGAKVIRLSSGVHDSTSVAALGIACHEAGHALQHAQSYAPLVLRSISIPAAAMGGRFGPLLIIIGFLLGVDPTGGGMGLTLVKVGLVLFASVLVFQLITLPVELNASARARLAVVRDGLVGDDEEARGVSRVLTAAAFTYVAAVISTLLILLYYAYRAGLLGGRSRN